MTDPSKPTDPPTAAASAPDGAPPPRAAAAPDAAALEGDDLFEEFALPGEAAAAKEDAAHVADAPLFEPAWEDEVDDGFAARLKAEVAART